METGEYWTFFVPPGWIFTGKIRAVTSEHVVIEEAIYQEQPTGEASAWDVLALGAKNAVGKSWPMPDGTLLLKSAILVAAPAATVATLARAREKDALRGK